MHPAAQEKLAVQLPINSWQRSTCAGCRGGIQCGGIGQQRQHANNGQHQDHQAPKGQVPAV